MTSLVAFQGIQALMTLKQQLNTVTEVESKKVMLSQMMRVHLVGMNQAENNIVVATTSQKIRIYQANFEDYATKFEAHFFQLRNLIDVKQKLNKKTLKLLQNNHQMYVKNFKQTLSLNRFSITLEQKIVLQGDIPTLFKELDKVTTLISIITKNKLSATLNEKKIDTKEVNKWVKMLNSLSNLEKNTLKSLQALQNLLLVGDTKKRELFKQQSNNGLQNALDDMKQLLPLFEQTYPSLAHNLREVLNRYHRLQRAMLELDTLNDGNERYQLAQDNKELTQESEEHLKQITTLSRKNMQQTLSETNQSYSDKKNQLILLSIITFFLGLSIAFLLFRNITVRIQRMIDFAERISKSEYPQPLSDDQNDELSTLSKMLNQLNKRFKNALWTKTGQSELSETMRGEAEVEQLAQKIITYLASYLNAHMGVVFLSNQRQGDKQRFRLLSSYAYQQRNGDKTSFALGEGLVGQVAREKKSILLSHIDPEQFNLPLDSGLGIILPRHIFALPVLLNNQVLAVLELGSAHEFKTLERDYLEQVAEGIAISLNTAMKQSQTKRLLKQTQQQAENLKAQEESVRQQNKTLKRTQSEVEEKAKQLALTSKYKSEFLANMSHELRTPLNSLLLFAHSLAENKTNHLDKEELESAMAIHDSGVDLLNLINEILDLAKIEARKISVEVTSMSPKALVQEVAYNFQRQAEEKGLDFTIQQADDFPELIDTDERRVKQILNNLLSNALKFTSQGGIAINIYRPQADQFPLVDSLMPEYSIAFSVTDTGTGIAKEKQRLIFEAFQQVDSSSNRQYGGTGLGLSISKELATLLGGVISVESKQATDTEQGESTFTLYLPQHCPKNDHKQAQSQNTVISIPFAKHLPSDIHIEDDRHHLTADDKTVLIIEDDHKFAKFVTDLAHAKGFKVLFAKDGEIGLTLAHEYQPKAIILDIHLPQLDGWTVMDELKSTSETRHIPVYFISIEEDNWEAMYMGAIGFLTKPVDAIELEQVFQKIDHVISKTFQRLLLVLASNELEQKIQTLIANATLETVVVYSGKEALNILKTKLFDCMVLDLNLSDMSGFELLNKSIESDTIVLPPVLVYTGKPLSFKEQQALKNYSTQVIKGISYERSLIDEITLFLHRSETELSAQQKAMLQPLYDDILFKNKTLLLVDDDARTIIALSHLLKSKGFKIRKAFDGQEALNALSRYADIDAVLIDIAMPNMDGYAAIEQIRKQEKFAMLPIIALTAQVMKTSKKSCLQAGANDYLSKPINPLKLFSRLRFWLSQQ